MRYRGTQVDTRRSWPRVIRWMRDADGWVRQPHCLAAPARGTPRAIRCSSEATESPCAAIEARCRGSNASKLIVSKPSSSTLLEPGRFSVSEPSPRTTKERTKPLGCDRRPGRCPLPRCAGPFRKACTPPSRSVSSWTRGAYLPPALIAQIRRIAAFQNPEFHNKQAMHLSTWNTPRIIRCAENLDHHVVLPRGCAGDLEALARRYQIFLALEDSRSDGEPLDLSLTGELTALQAEAVESLMAHETGVFVAPPGVGKTVVATGLIARRERSTLILVHRRHLLDQWRGQLALFLGIEPTAEGQIGSSTTPAPSAPPRHVALHPEGSSTRSLTSNAGMPVASSTSITTSAT